MKQWKNFSAFNKVKLEIESLVDEMSSTLEQLLNHAAGALETKEKLTICSDKLHEIAGVLRMMEYNEFALLTDEMLALIKEAISLKEPKDQQARTELVQVLFVSSIAFSATLEGVLSGDAKKWHDYSLLVNTIRKARGASLVFSSDPLLKKKNHDYKALFKEESLNLNALIVKQLDVYKLAIKYLENQEKQKECIKAILSVFINLELFCRDYTMGTLWGLCTALTESLPTQVEQLNLSNERLSFLCSFTDMISKIAEEGDSSLNEYIPGEILEKILGELSQAESNSERLYSAKLWYKIDLKLSKASKVNNQNLMVNYLRKGAYIKSTKLLAENINELNNAINDVVASDVCSNEQLVDFINKLRGIQSTIYLFDMSDFEDKINANIIELDVSRESNSEGRNVDDILAKTAQTLYQTEVALHSKAEEISRAVFSSTSNSDMPEGFTGVKLSLVLAAIKNLDLIILGINAYIDSGCESTKLIESSSLLTEVIAALKAIPLEKVVKLTEGAKLYAEKVIKAKHIHSIDDLFHDFAHLIINISIYLDQVTIGQANNYDDLINDSFKLLTKIDAYEVENLEVEDAKAEELSSNEEKQDESLISKENTKNETTAEVIVLEVTPNKNREAQTEVEADSGYEIDEEIKEIFIEEVDEILGHLEESYNFLKNDLSNKEALVEFRRGFHTLKGSGRMVEATAIAEIAWNIEDLLNNIIESAGEFTDELLITINDIRSELPTMLEDYKLERNSAFDISSVDHLVNSIKRFTNGNEVDEETTDEIILDKAISEKEPVFNQDAALSKEDRSLTTDESEDEKHLENKVEPAVEIIEKSDAQNVNSEISAEDSIVLTEANEYDSQREEIQIQVETEFDLFIRESEKQLSKISEFIENPMAIDDSKESITTTSFLIPVHTLYGNCRVAGFASFAELVEPLERLLHEHPYRKISKNLKQLLRHFCNVSNSVIDQVKEKQNFQVSVDLLSGHQDYLDSLDEVNAELQGNVNSKHSGEKLIESENTTLESSSNLNDDDLAQNEEQILLQGFLSEAVSINARIQILFEEMQTNPSNIQKFSALQDQLNILEGAAHMANQTAIAQLSHQLSESYHVCIDELGSITNTTIDLLKECHLSLDSNIKLLSSDKPLIDPSDLINKLQSLFSQLVIEKNKERVAAEEEQVEESLLIIFLEEADEILTELEGKITDWHQSQDDKTISDELLRSLHTLKGSAALVGEQEISDEAHLFESYIINATKIDNKLDESFFVEIDSKLSTLQKLYSLYHKNAEGRVVRSEMTDNIADTEDSETLEKNINPKKPDNETSEELITLNTESQARAHVEANSNSEDIQQKQSSALDEHVRVSGKLLRGLLNNADEINISRNKVEQNMSEFSSLLVDMDDTLDRLQGYIENFETQTKTTNLVSIGNTSTEANEIANSSQDFDALEMDKYTELQQISLSLLEDYEDLKDIKKNLNRKMQNIDTVLMEQQRSTNSLQDGLISSQMVPFAGIVPRLRRLTRQVSSELNKNVEIKFSNPEGKIDRSILQALVNPIEHMIRNAIDHGIESIEDRVKTGKPDKAKILVSLYRQGANIILDISDDGKGINVSAIKRLAIKQGLLSKDEKISDQAAYQLILKSGFSTSGKVSNISGRGVGLDVVNTEISLIGGELDIDSKIGSGTTFRLRLPLTSSLNRALLFTVNGTQYAMLLNTIDAIMLETVENIRKLDNENGVGSVQYSNKTYELTYMGAMLDENIKPKLESIDSSVSLLLISAQNRNMALQIDSIIGSRDLVVKSLGSHFSSVIGLSGAVILGDGRVVTVLDPLALVDNYSIRNDKLLQTVLSENVKNEHSGKENGGIKTVMVVDDSITVRKVTSTILKRNGMEVIIAKNGLEAVEILQTQLPDIMLLDIEMPKMDGFEVASYIRRQDSKMKNLPIIMITSRIGDKHRARAEEIGVNQYMCKPFQEENLLEAISDYVNS